MLLVCMYVVPAPPSGTLVLLSFLPSQLPFQILKTGFPPPCFMLAFLRFFYDSTLYKQQPSPSHPTPPKPHHHRPRPRLCGASLLVLPLLASLSLSLSIHTSAHQSSMGEHNGGVSTTAMRAAHRGMPAQPPTRPKIKIIHIIAPEIIKTDVAHFRDLVQRLTGKPAACAASRTSVDDVASTPPPVGEDEMETTTKKRPRPALPAPVADDERSDFKVQEEPVKKRKIKCEVKVEEGGLGDYDLDRSDLWMDLNPGGFLSFLEEEGVFQGLAADHDFLQPFASSRMDLVGEMYAA